MSTAIELNRPSASEYDPYYEPYLSLVTEDDILVALENQVTEFKSVFRDISSDVAGTVHPPYRWSIKEAVGHIIDNERVFGYRLLRFASGDLTPLPGYEQDEYIERMEYAHTDLPSLSQELEWARRANVAFIRRISANAWDAVGTADGNQISVRAIVYLLVGHLRHHLEIIKKRVSE